MDVDVDLDVDKKEKRAYNTGVYGWDILTAKGCLQKHHFRIIHEATIPIKLGCGDRIAPICADTHAGCGCIVTLGGVERVGWNRRQESRRQESILEQGSLRWPQKSALDAAAVI